MGADNNKVSSKEMPNPKNSFGDINLIKSKYIIKYIFNHINSRKKLKIILYNKELINKLEYNIEDYKKLSEKEIRVEKNGRGKEFIINSNIIIFEGEYTKGKRNGKGKEYYINGKLKCEGNYLNN